ncbi:LOW QUALITY PROTEIN: coiled-coil domain-containing protein 89 [Theristicus caerulescens]
MANPASDPEKGKDVEDLRKGLEELCESPEEEKSEKALLHSPPEQHHLICRKKKADDAHKCCKGLEQLTAELEKLRREDAVTMKTQTQRIQHLEGRFTDLANNHEKMIQLKDEHRKRCTQLREENTRLRQEKEALFSQTVREKEAEALQLAAQARKLSQQLDSLQEKCESRRAQEREKELLEAQSQQASAYAQEVNSLKNQLQRLQKLQQSVARVEQAESQQRAQGSERQANLERAKEEKERLLNVAMERDKALQDKEREIQQLGKELESAEKARQRAGKRLVKEAAAVDNDLKARELQGQLKSSRQAYNELLLQSDAHRKHSTDLLTKERALNAKLRHFTAAFSSVLVSAGASTVTHHCILFLSMRPSSGFSVRYSPA